jgi:methylated-DNA-[protein]-cysteine S-methyltransferase
MLGYALFDTAIGRCAIGWTADGIAAVQLPQPTEAQTIRRMQQRGARAAATPPPLVAETIAAITKLLEGERHDLNDITLDLAGAPLFHQQVYAIARTIAPGRTLTYGDIARTLGDVTLSREVGQALGRNPCPIIVPCHRVLAAGGRPGGFSANGGVATKLKILTIEGALVNHTPSLFDVP